MLTALRELLASLTPGGHFWLALALVAALLAVFFALLLTGSDLAPLWRLLGG